MDFRLNRSLLVGPASDRMAEERRILAEHFPGFSLWESHETDEYAVAAGRLSTFTGRRYALRIVLPAAYPHGLPKIIPDGWKPNSNPHMIGGGLCVMKSSQWQSYMSVAFIVAKSALWLNKYEIYVDKGIWPGAEQHIRGPVYKARKWWHGL